MKVRAKDIKPTSTMTVRRYDGQILNCAYGHHWPLNLFLDGFVRISVETTRRGNIKVRYKWAAERQDLA